MKLRTEWLRMCGAMMDASNGIRLWRSLVRVCVCADLGLAYAYASNTCVRCDSYLFELCFSVTVAIRVNHECHEVAFVIINTNTFTINSATTEYRQGDRFSENRCLAC